MIQFAELFKECLSQFRATPEFAILNKVRVGNESLSAQDRQSILDSVVRTFTPMFDQIKADVSSLTDSDLVFCVLSNLGVSASTIAECLTISPHTVRVRKHRLREKLPASWYDVFYGDGDVEDVEAPADEVSHEPALPFMAELSHCFRKYLNTKGRASRKEYFCFLFFAAIAIFTINRLDDKLYCMTYMANLRATDGFFTVLLHVINWIFVLGIMVPLYTVTVRRLHDLNSSGFLAMLFCGLSCAVVIAQRLLFLFFSDELYGGRLMTQDETVYVLGSLHISNIILLILFFVQILVFSVRGTKGANDYGTDPLKK